MSDRLEYLCYRCQACHRLLTKLEIIATWEANEAKGATVQAICPCGGNRIAPSNPTPEEEDELFSPEQKRRYYQEGVRDHKTRLIELWEKEVKGKDLGPAYGGSK